VHFWGSDSAIEISFFINEDALTTIQPGVSLDESGFLSAFDANRDLICAAAAKVYIRGSRGSYDLGAENFLKEFGCLRRKLRFEAGVPTGRAPLGVLVFR
jgi:hypothetical protein